MPDTFRDDERSIAIDLTKDLETTFLRIEEAVSGGFVVVVETGHRGSKRGEGGDEIGLHRGLGGPAALVGGGAGIPARGEKNILMVHTSDGFES